VIEIRPIQQRQIKQAKQIVTTVCLEAWRDIVTEEELNCYDSMSDIEHMPLALFDNGGVFLVLVDDEQVVGTGANPKT
jgi:putative acetyltransferase